MTNKERKKAMQKAREAILNQDYESAWNALYEPPEKKK